MTIDITDMSQRLESLAYDLTQKQYTPGSTQMTYEALRAIVDELRDYLSPTNAQPLKLTQKGVVTRAGDLAWADQWCCPRCGGDRMVQAIQLEDAVFIHSYSKKYMAETDGLLGDYTVEGRGDITCTGCGLLVSIPDEVQVLEWSELPDDEEE